MPKTPEATLVAAQTYMYTMQPNPGDPREHMHRAALQGLRLLGNKITAKEEEKPTDYSFHGIIPGSANYLLGRIALDVCYGNRQNYRKEKLDFEVMDWPSRYHTILGQPTFS
jgi:hypothetical protein